MNAFFNKNRVVLLHISFWWVYLSFFVYQISTFRRKEFELDQALFHAGVQVAFNMFVSYLNYFIFLPRFLEKKNLGQYLLEFTVPFIILIWLRVQLQRYLMDGYTHHEHYFYSTTFVIQTAGTTLFIVIFVAMLRFAKDWFEFEARKKEVENEHLTAELNFLKAQINPHFLFNTLNNLYYLAYSKSENTTEVIAKLSQMMRYMIYESNYPMVPVSKEIDYMQSYISLERLRLNNQIPIQFDIEGDVNAAKIAPLILITFLENAFKHGVSANDPNSWVSLSLQVKGKECLFKVENSKVRSVNSDSGEKSGIGLQNVKRRLELSYPHQYQLAISDKPDRYSVELKLTLS
jgi:two-component system sensor histidine kinase AlgZ